MDEEDLIDVNDPQNYLRYIQAITFSQAELLSLNSKILKSLDLLTLDANSLDPLQLKYDMLSVRPRMSQHFVQKIVEVATSYNYVEIGRESMLYEGKQQIGDLDVVLRNQNSGKYLFIEAKCHSLTTGVQGHDPRAIKERLQENTKWQDKVNRRLEKLNSLLLKGTEFRYIIVTKKPEPCHTLVICLLLLSMNSKLGLSSMNRKNLQISLTIYTHEGT